MNLKDLDLRFLDLLPDGVMIVDAEGRVFYANPALAKILKKPLSEILKSPCFQLIHGTSQHPSFCVYERMQAEGKPVSLEFFEPHLGLWLWVYGAPIKDENGKIRGCFHLIRDVSIEITERKRLEERVKRILENHPLAFFVNDWEGNIKWANPAFKKFLNIPMDVDVTRLKSRDFYVRPEDRDQLLQNLKEKGELLDYEVELKDFQGRRLWVSSTLKLVEEDGEYYLWGTLQDITPRKRAEQALAEREALFRALAENAPLAVILMDEEGKIIYFNPAAEKIFGYRAEEVLGKDLYLTLSPPKYHETYLKSFQRVRSTGKSRLAGKRQEFEARRKDGTCFPVEILISIIYLPDKHYYLGLVQDISERKRIEAERLQFEKHRALELLAGGIAHDFNNLLTSLIGNLELAERLTEEPRVKEILRRAEKAAQNAKDLARELLTFSKGDIPVPKEVDLKSVIEDLARFILRGSPVKLHLEIQEGLPPVKIDPTHLAQVLQNLIINAKETMPEGGDLFIQAAQVDDGVVLVVRDTGPGIPPEILPRIFEPGFTTKPAGTGLGLSVVKSVLERYRGKISVHSVPGKGATFKIFLPAEVSAPKPTPREEKKSPVKDEVPKFSGRILIMDDEELVRQSLKEILQFWGFTVETAEDGKEALEKYQKALEMGKPFDLVILDLTVPGGKGGIWTLERLRQIEPRVKAILSTGYTLEDARALVKDLPFMEILRKPYTTEDLLQTLRKYFSERKP